MPDINKSYQWAINTCNAPDVGYSLTWRAQQRVNGVTYYDCSSFVWYALQNGGFEGLGSYPFTTDYIPDTLLRMGFGEFPVSGEWKTGDIVWRPKGYHGHAYGHVEFVYEGGQGSGRTMGAHSNSYPLPDQVSINNRITHWNDNYGYTRLFRWGEGGASGYGSSLYVISAICGNFWSESHINPGQGEIQGGGYGLGQWTGSRRVNLGIYMRDHGYAIDDGNGQLEFLLQENDWINNFGNFATIQDFLTSDSTDIDYLTEAWMRNWEKPRESTAHLEERIEYAHRYYDFINEHAQDSTITDWIKRSTLLSPNESDNNAVLVYRYLSTGGGGGGEPDKGLPKMPVWMMCKPWWLM